MNRVDFSRTIAVSTDMFDHYRSLTRCGELDDIRNPTLVKTKEKCTSLLELLSSLYHSTFDRSLYLQGLTVVLLIEEPQAKCRQVLANLQEDSSQQNITDALHSLLEIRDNISSKVLADVNDARIFRVLYQNFRDQTRDVPGFPFALKAILLSSLQKEPFQTIDLVLETAAMYAHLEEIELAMHLLTSHHLLPPPQDSYHDTVCAILELLAYQAHRWGFEDQTLEIRDFLSIRSSDERH
ncbi:MAG: hypothetical protein ACD_17C00254G0003 [uncultured bacterium]|nr:MAG: hypothetical protein ACD_17C00254G0003 [uncultured bacterium]OGN55639.1 MAG: hypothetical protein A2796_00490 [Chlamydiae bacterium RIFCSPHIGHO2_01_FULL_44_39]OGN59241.1 MAG: hypothetical protein A3C42_03935 [Chlamydiae bacterium RIFCSPHIGHO2_02_FULL_45_9]OGN60431.1 MAG: hypothetical protein A3D96_00915 [Chlamydiae bacterium RIFCSPHIGHO2_12_FULL_44_59]OGN66552.1 MAG: hypothetical protein A2978_05100 [Chlamydiae bacterium RIFCSPLOWO2_01_FULL_44_52]OGN69801.1 MAG: hypothetical protein A3